MKWFDKINSVFDAEKILAGYCICRHAPELHNSNGQCTWDKCAVECILPPPDGLVQEAREFLAAAQDAACPRPSGLDEKSAAYLLDPEISPAVLAERIINNITDDDGELRGYVYAEKVLSYVLHRISR